MTQNSSSHQPCQLSQFAILIYLERSEGKQKAQLSIDLTRSTQIENVQWKKSKERRRGMC